MSEYSANNSNFSLKVECPQFSKEIWETTAQSILALILLIVTIISNGSILVIVTRNKLLRTLPNLMASNLALVDLLNALINIPLLVGYHIYEVSYLEKRAAAWASLFLHFYLGICLNLVSMFVMSFDRYLALSVGLKYTGNKTKRGVFAFLIAVWIATATVSVVLYRPLWKINVRCPTVAMYRKVFIKKLTGPPVLSAALFIVLNLILYILTRRAIKASEIRVRQINGMGKAVSRTKSIQAIKTSAMITVMYFLCFIAALFCGFLSNKMDTIKLHWLRFSALYLTFCSGPINAFVYATRTQTFRNEFRKLWRWRDIMKRGGKVAPTQSSQKNPSTRPVTLPGPPR